MILMQKALRGATLRCTGHAQLRTLPVPVAVTSDLGPLPCRRPRAARRAVLARLEPTGASRRAAPPPPPGQTRTTAQLPAPLNTSPPQALPPRG